VLRAYYVILHIWIAIREFLMVALKPSIWKCFLYFQFEYFFFSPYYYADKTAQDDLVFGYTPLNVYHRFFQMISRQMNGWAQDLNYLDVGCGDGRGALYAASYYKIKVTAIDTNHNLINKLSCLVRILKLANVKTLLQSFFDIDWSEYDIIFCAWSTFKDQTKERMVNKMKRELKFGAFVISLSDPIQDTDFTIMEQFRAMASWGSTTVFIHQYQAVK